MRLRIIIVVAAISIWLWIFYEVKNAPELDENGNIVNKKKDKN